MEITFSNAEEAHRAYQEAALVNNNFVPFQGAATRPLDMGFLSLEGPGIPFPCVGLLFSGLLGSAKRSHDDPAKEVLRGQLSVNTLCQ